MLSLGMEKTTRRGKRMRWNSHWRRGRRLGAHHGGFALHHTRAGSFVALIVIIAVCSVIGTIWASLAFCPDEFFAWIAAPNLDYTVEGVPKSFLFCVAYCSFVIILQLMSGSWLLRRMRARSSKTAGIFVVVQLIAAFIALTAAMQVEMFLLEREFDIYKASVIWMITFMFSLLFSSYMYMVRVNHELGQARQTALHSELRALRAQINPHFLFNALNSIASLIRLRPNEAEEVTEQLADLFRYSLRASDRSVVSLADELYAVELYLQIEESRFRDRLSVEWAIPEDIKRASIPSLSLQPLVENSVKHGLNKTEDACTIAVSANRIGDMVSIVVADTGPGFSTTEREQVFAKGTGLANVFRRLQLEFGPQADLVIQQHHVEVLIPYVELSGRSSVRPPDSSDKHVPINKTAAGAGQNMA